MGGSRSHLVATCSLLQEQAGGGGGCDVLVAERDVAGARLCSYTSRQPAAEPNERPAEVAEQIAQQVKKGEGRRQRRACEVVAHEGDASVLSVDDRLEPYLLVRRRHERYHQVDDEDCRAGDHHREGRQQRRRQRKRDGVGSKAGTRLGRGEGREWRVRRVRRVWVASITSRCRARGAQ